MSNEVTIKGYQKTYRENNKEKRKEYDKIYRKKYREANKEKLKEYNKFYRSENKEKINEYIKNRLDSDSLFKLRKRISISIITSLKRKNHNKNSNTEQILGCSFQEFKQHIESQWEPWMSWDNYGNPKDGLFEPNKNWDIDHIIPSSSAKNEDELLLLNKYQNLQPLCSYFNRFIKTNKTVN